MMPTLSAPIDLPAPALAPPPRAPRCTIGLRHYRRRQVSITPTSAAIAGALDIYLEGRRSRDVLRMLFGLSILRSATTDQVNTALAARRGAGDPDAPDVRDPFEAEPPSLSVTIL